MNDDSSPRHHCGLFGCYGIPNASYITYLGLYAQQHRGQESAGIAVSDGEKFQSKKQMGLVSEIFNENDFEKLPGHIAVGHVRYSTTGSSRITNVQPLVVKYYEGMMAIAHNGNLVNARTLKHELEREGSIFQTGTDSEVLVHLMANPKNRAEPKPLAACLTQLKGAFSMLMMKCGELIGFRDPHGFRPLALGKLDDGYVIASETCAFDLVGAKYIREIDPGEIVRINDQGVHSEFFSDPNLVTPQHCLFETVYFARPDSMIFGENVHTVRVKMGRQLFREQPAVGDIVVPVPDGGNSAALGYSHESGIPLEFGLIRNHYVGRTFINPTQIERAKSADIKINVLREVVSGKRVVVVDDSLIRGTTFRKRARQLYAAGATEIHLRIACPPTRHPCYYGIDFPTQEELLAQHKSLDEIREFLGIESIGYLSEEGMFASVKHPGDHYCTACWSGRYAVPRIDGDADKIAMEWNARQLNRRSRRP